MFILRCDGRLFGVAEPLHVVEPRELFSLRFEVDVDGVTAVVESLVDVVGMRSSRRGGRILPALARARVVADGADACGPRADRHADGFGVRGVLRAAVEVQAVEDDGSAGPLVNALVEHGRREHVALVVVLDGEAREDARGQALDVAAPAVEGGSVVAVRTADVDVDARARVTWQAHDVHDGAVERHVLDGVEYDGFALGCQTVELRRMEGEALAVSDGNLTDALEAGNDEVGERHLKNVVLGGPGHHVGGHAEDLDAVISVPLHDALEVCEIFEDEAGDVLHALALEGGLAGGAVAGDALLLERGVDAAVSETRGHRIALGSLLLLNCSRIDCNTRTERPSRIYLSCETVTRRFP